MAFFDDKIECKNRVDKKVRVPGQQGHSDRNIYVNGNKSGYYLGDGNNKIYRNGQFKSSSSIPEFAKQNLGFYFVCSLKPHICGFSLKKNN